MRMGFIRPHPHRLFALDSGRRSSGRPAFTPHIPTTIVDYLYTEHEDNTREFRQHMLHHSVTLASIRVFRVTTPLSCIHNYCEWQGK
jgi:hypothetical protein